MLKITFNAPEQDLTGLVPSVPWTYQFCHAFFYAISSLACVQFHVNLWISQGTVVPSWIPKLFGICPSRCLTRVHCRVDLGLPKVEVRVEDLHIETEVYAETDRQLPSLFNAVRSSVEASLPAVTFAL